MAQFDVYENLGNNNETIPYLVDVQNDVLDQFSTRMVIPLVLDEKETNLINPEIVIDSKKYILLTTQMAGICVHRLGKKITSLKDKRTDIVNAIDFLITGF